MLHASYQLSILWTNELQDHLILCSGSIDTCYYFYNHLLGEIERELNKIKHICYVPAPDSHSFYCPQFKHQHTRD